MGYGYVFTNAMLIMAAVMLLRDFPKNKKGIAQFFIGIPLIIVPNPATSSPPTRISRKSAIQAHCLHAK